MKSCFTRRLCYDIVFHAFLMLVLGGCQLLKAKISIINSEGFFNLYQRVNNNSQNFGDYNPTIQPADFVNAINNPYLSLQPGMVWIYAGKDDHGRKIEIEEEVTSNTKIIRGVTTTVVRKRVWQKNKLIREVSEWYAQDKGGNVWSFGKESKKLKNSEIIDTTNSWEAGINGAKPGIVMKAYPRAGDTYRQEFVYGKAENIAQVLSNSQTTKIGLGEYKNCLQIQSWTRLEPALVEYRFYSKEVGNVLRVENIEGDSGEMTLVAMKTGPPTL